MPLAAFAAADIEFSAAATEPAAGVGHQRVTTNHPAAGAATAPPKSVPRATDGYVFMDEDLAKREEITLMQAPCWPSSKHLLSQFTVYRLCTVKVAGSPDGNLNPRTRHATERAQP